MKIKFNLLFLFFTCYNFSQEVKIKENPKIPLTYIQIDLSVPLRKNININQYDANNNQNKNVFLPDGLAIKYGYGIQRNKWIGLSLHTGID